MANERIQVDPLVVESLARRLRALVETAEGEWTGIRDHAIRGLGAIPASDLHDSYACCWGRWSQTMVRGTEELLSAARRTQDAAEKWADTEHQQVRSLRGTSPDGGPLQ